MSNKAEHSKQIIKIAKRVLGPVGFRQKGSSRTFLSDECFWSCIVEFQPSGWARGSYLNVGAHWLWSDKDHISFDYGHRVTEFEEATEPEAFDAAMESFAVTASDEARRLRAVFSSVSAAAEELKRKEESAVPGCWNAYNCGIACGLAGDWPASLEMFAQVIASPAEFDWMIARREDAQRLSSLTDDPAEFQKEIEGRTSRTRHRLKLS